MLRSSPQKHGDNSIVIKGAKTHNLKNIDVTIPRDSLTVITGLSGSGKSSLAFDTIFAEGQRRYIESLSAYARQFLRQMQKPEVDEITGLSPAISIDQKNRSNNPRSTVATITEIYDYLRVLFARVGVPHCPKCDCVIDRVSQEEIIKQVEKQIVQSGWLEKSKKLVGVSYNDRTITVYAPIVVGRKGEYYQLLYDLLHRGYEQVRIDGTTYNLRRQIKLALHKKHDIDIVVDTIFVSEFAKNPKVFRERLSDAVERSIHEANGLVRLAYPVGDEQIISSHFLCPKCGFSFPEVEPRLFSFNSPHGACPACNGLGQVDMLIDDACVTCHGARLRPEALAVYIGTGKKRKSIIDVIKLSIEESRVFFDRLSLTDRSEKIAKPLFNEIVNRIQFMLNVGLGYLTLDRKANTLSGGEAQRIRLASQLGSGLVGALYVLDEPTIGLHQRDNDRLIETLLQLRDAGNTIIVVEHDENTIFHADYIVDIGPGAGITGGTIVASGFLQKLLTAKENKTQSRTLAYLRGEIQIPVPDSRRTASKGMLQVAGAHANNLQNINVKVPLGRITVITGVSGSGKSTLLYNILHKNLQAKLIHSQTTKKVYDVKTFTGYEYLDRAVLVSQSPIGRTPRSTPVTYVGAFTHIRDLFAYTEDARYRGWKPSRFSFNVPGGRCERCSGNGFVAVEMHFLPTVFITCDVCRGKRFTKEVLDIAYRGKNINDVLTMQVDTAADFFQDVPAIHERLQALVDVGLGYLALGQSSTTLSGGEAQRVKLAAELYRPYTRKTIYLLDEPTVGLHYDDVQRLIGIINCLVDRGNTAVIIEHNMDVIKSADYLIDLGLEGGVRGGKVIATGTPEEVATIAKSQTAPYLKRALK